MLLLVNEKGKNLRLIVFCLELISMSVKLNTLLQERGPDMERYCYLVSTTVITDPPVKEFSIYSQISTGRFSGLLINSDKW